MGFISLFILAALYPSVAEAKGESGQILVRVTMKSGDEQPAGSFLATLQIHDEFIRILPVLDDRSVATGRDPANGEISYRQLQRTSFLNRAIVRLDVRDVSGQIQTWFLAPPASFERRDEAVSSENAVRILSHAILTHILREIENRSTEMPVEEFADRIDDAIRICDFDPNLPDCGRFFLFLKLWAERQKAFTATNPNDSRRGDVGKIADQLSSTFGQRRGTELIDMKKWQDHDLLRVKQTRREEAVKALDNLKQEIANVNVPSSNDRVPVVLETPQADAILQEAGQRMKRLQEDLEWIRNWIESNPENLEKLGSLKEVLEVLVPQKSRPVADRKRPPKPDRPAPEPPAHDYGGSRDMESYMRELNADPQYRGRPSQESVDLEEFVEKAMREINKSANP